MTLGTGQCYMEEVVYDCDEGKTVLRSRGQHDKYLRELPCIGTDCSAGTAEKNKDFGQAAGLLQAMSFISADGNLYRCQSRGVQVFPGEQKYCRLGGGSRGFPGRHRLLCGARGGAKHNVSRHGGI